MCVYIECCLCCLYSVSVVEWFWDGAVSSLLVEVLIHCFRSSGTSLKSVTVSRDLKQLQIKLMPSMQTTDTCFSQMFISSSSICIIILIICFTGHLLRGMLVFIRPWTFEGYCLPPSPADRNEFVLLWYNYKRSEGFWSSSPRQMKVAGVFALSDVQMARCRRQSPLRPRAERVAFMPLIQTPHISSDRQAHIHTDLLLSEKKLNLCGIISDMMGKDFRFHSNRRKKDITGLWCGNGFPSPGLIPLHTCWSPQHHHSP